jgi:hypothetical protein
MPLAAGYLLLGVLASFTTHLGRLDALGVDDAGGGPPVLAGLLAG